MFICFACGYPFVPTQFAKEFIPTPLNLPLVLPMYVWVYAGLSIL